MQKHTLEQLRKDSHTIHTLPEQAQKLADRYFHITVQGTDAACPYHINTNLRSTNRALVGKGTPEEIETAAELFFKRYALTVTPGDSQELRTFLESCGIGVDCSGFTTWILDAMTQTNLQRRLWQCLTIPGLRGKIVRTLRPVQNISARLLTNQHNSTPVTDIRTIRPGDLLRVSNGNHVVIISEVGTNESGEACYFQYYQSSCMYGSDSGVRSGYTQITHPHGYLKDQHWFDNTDRSTDMASKVKQPDARLVRLRVFS